MLKKIALLPLLALALVGCERADKKDSKTVPQPGHDRVAVEASDDQVTQNIKKAIQDDRSLSDNSRNVQVTVVKGVVTLKGKVPNDRERRLIIQKAGTTRGVTHVRDHLEISK